MGWFSQLCRNIGLMVHNIRHPDGKEPQRKELRRQVDEERRGNVTLRRTTIEEIEFDGEANPGNRSAAADDEATKG